ncbi:hypothetical protein Mucpa_5847 [Mucilaginibacter paludis DSM 18603]|uniref:Uncharacterized protein n=1 Tax=Mucilaginibacter paludis DSM 18603 TaxID=714943 RepID=H1Y7R8_9SPHI|nr:hypothetical protein Mucpa_5847 [Mucilaginibacter paludis DSM 18603]
MWITVFFLFLHSRIITNIFYWAPGLINFDYFKIILVLPFLSKHRSQQIDNIWPFQVWLDLFQPDASIIFPYLFIKQTHPTTMNTKLISPPLALYGITQNTSNATPASYCLHPIKFIKTLLTWIL